MPAGQPVVTGTIISSTTHNNTMSDIASEMTNSVDKDGQTVLTGIIDHNGNNIILDTDGDTLLDLGTDDQVGLTIAGAEDFLFLANIFRALSGSVLETNTINATTAGSGVTIDSVVLKNNTVLAGTLLLGAGSVTDSSGAITFGNENLSTTGTAATGPLTVTGTLGVSNTVTITNGDQSLNRLKLSNTGAGGKEWHVIGGTNALNNSGFQIRNETDGINALTFTSTGAATLSSTLGVSGDFTITDGATSSTNSADENNVTISSTHATYTQSINRTVATRAATSSYNFHIMQSGAGADNEFNLRGDGTGLCDGSWTGGGADYAEWFEWSDGNPTNEDRAGYAVTLDGNKIRLASEGDTLIGVVSVMPGVVGDGDIGRWKGKYQKDDFGRYIFEEYSQVEWVEILEPAVEGVEHVEAVEYQAATDATYDDESVLLTEETPEVLAVAGVEGIAAKDAVTKDHSYQYDAIPEGLTAPKDAVVTSEDENGVKLERRKLSVDYVEAPYISREDRQEWSTVGLMGKLRIRKGQPVATSWIKMREISASVDEWLVK